MKLNVPVYKKNVNSERLDEPARPRSLARACARIHTLNSGKN